MSERYKDMKNNWTPLSTAITDLPLYEVLTIIDDATSNGFEFKVENHEVYFREIQV